MTNNDKVWYVNQYESEKGYPKDSIVNVMIMESGLNPQAVNSVSGATGLIQFMAATALGLGTTTEKLKAMDFQEQMYYVDRYFNNYRSKLLQSNDPFDFYCATLYPVLIGKPDTYVFAQSPTKIYTQNYGFDVNKDGTTTKAEIRQKFYSNVNRFRAGLGLSETTGVYSQSNPFDIKKIGVPIVLMIAGIVIWSNE